MRVLIAILLCLSLGQKVYSQSTYRPELNLPYYDDKWFHPGFFVAVNFANYYLQHDPNFFTPSRLDSVVAANPIGSPGITLGFIAGIRLHDQVHFKFLPGVSFYTRGVELDFANGERVRETIENTFLELPLMLKVRSQRKKNFRMYILGGVKPSLEIGSRLKERTEDQLRTLSSDVAIEYGFGFDFYFEMFKFAPEIRFSHGFNNMINSDPNIFATSVESLKSHTVTIYLNFE
ncbi:MAG: porin family protein [Cytophagales bacterium]